MWALRCEELVVWLRSYRFFLRVTTGPRTLAPPGPRRSAYRAKQRASERYFQSINWDTQIDRNNRDVGASK
jgi:hypothetical protein